MTLKIIRFFLIYFMLTIGLKADWHDFDNRSVCPSYATYFDKETYQKAQACIMDYLHEQHDFNDDRFDVFNNLNHADQGDYSEALTHRFLENFSHSWNTFFDDGKKELLKRVHRQMLRDLSKKFNNDWQSFFDHEQNNWLQHYNYF